MYGVLVSEEGGIGFNWMLQNPKLRCWPEFLGMQCNIMQFNLKADLMCSANKRQNIDTIKKERKKR